jgi:hypothetical protein
MLLQSHSLRTIERDHRLPLACRTDIFLATRKPPQRVNDPWNQEKHPQGKLDQKASRSMRDGIRGCSAMCTKHHPLSFIFPGMKSPSNDPIPKTTHGTKIENK